MLETKHVKNNIKLLHVSVNVLPKSTSITIARTGGVVQCVVRLTRDRWIPVTRELEPHQRPRCFLEQETLL